MEFFSKKRKYVLLLQLLHLLFLLRSHFFQLEYMHATSRNFRITDRNVLLAALTSILLIIIAAHET
jgi:hypothetical protein